MADANAETVTRVLNDVASDDSQASAELLPLVYEQLRRLAKSKMRQERSDQTLQATALVQKACIRLVGNGESPQWDGRWHFFAAAAEAMRRILVDNARRRSRIKRGGGLPTDIPSSPRSSITATPTSRSDRSSSGRSSVCWISGETVKGSTYPRPC